MSEDRVRERIRAPRLTDRRGAALLALACAVASAGLSGYVASLPHFLFGVHSFTGTGYDDGVYYGAVDHFVHGVMPYRSFTFVQPPGVLVLLAPLGLLGRIIGTPDALAVGRILTLIVAAANAGLAAWIVRSRGRLAMIVAGLALACFPLAVTADHTMNLEPYLVLLWLVATSIAFTDGGLATGRRLLVAGVVLGVATDLKVWGVGPAVALVICCLPQWRRAAAAVTGWLIGLLVVALPFFALAPHAFWHEVVISQLRRRDTVAVLSIVQRFGLMLGVNDQTNLTAHRTTIIALAVVIAAAVLGCYAAWWRSITRLEWFIGVAAGLTIAGLSVSRQFYDHYTYATVAYLTPLVAVTVSRYVAAIRGMAERRGVAASRMVVRAGWALAVVAVAATALVVVPNDTSRAKAFLAGALPVDPAIKALIPAGSCVATDDPILLIEADRWDASGPCTAITDPFGIFVSTDGRPPPGQQPFPASLVAPWSAAFTQAQYVVLSVQGSDYVPFNAGLIELFDSRFVMLYNGPHAVIYGR